MGSLTRSSTVAPGSSFSPGAGTVSTTVLGSWSEATCTKEATKPASSTMDCASTRPLPITSGTCGFAETYSTTASCAENAWPTPGCTSTTVPSSAVEAFPTTCTFCAPAVASRLIASSCVRPSTSGMVRLCATVTVTVEPTARRTPVSGSWRSTTPMPSSAVS